MTRVLTLVSIVAVLAGIEVVRGLAPPLIAAVEQGERPWFELPSQDAPVEPNWFENIRPRAADLTSLVMVAGAGVIHTLERSGQLSSPIVLYGADYPGPITFAIGSLSGDPASPVPMLLAGPAGPSANLPMRAFNVGPPPQLLGEIADIPGMGAGLLIAMDNVTGDAADEVFLTPGPGVPSEVHLISVNRDEVTTFMPFGAFTGGVRLATGDLNGDGFAELLTTQVNGPGFKVWTFPNGEPHEVANGFPFGPSMPGGIWPDAFDLNNDGVDEILTGAGSGPPRVRILDVRPPEAKVVADFLAAPAATTDGVRATAGVADGKPVVVTATRQGIRVLQPAARNPWADHEFFHPSAPLPLAAAAIWWVELFTPPR